MVSNDLNYIRVGGPFPVDNCPSNWYVSNKLTLCSLSQRHLQNRNNKTNKTHAESGTHIHSFRAPLLSRILSPDKKTLEALPLACHFFVATTSPVQNRQAANRQPFRRMSPNTNTSHELSPPKRPNAPLPDPRHTSLGPSLNPAVSLGRRQFRWTHTRVGPGPLNESPGPRRGPAEWTSRRDRAGPAPWVLVSTTQGTQDASNRQLWGSRVF